VITTTVQSDHRPRQMLTASAYNEEAFPALRLTRSSRLARLVARCLLVTLVLTVVAMLLAPWQQTVSGAGEVVAFAPLDRQQVIEAPIQGRIVRWGENIRENAPVTKGQLVLEIRDLDPQLLERLSMQLAAGQRQLAANRQRLEALRRQLAASETIVQSYEAQAEAFREVKQQVVAAAEQYIAMAKSNIAAERRNLESARATRIQAEADFQRQKQLYDEGLTSQLKMQLAERKFREAKAKEDRASDYIAAAESELRAKQRERDAKEREAQAKIDSAEATLKKAHGDVAKGESEIAKAEENVNKLEKELLDLQVKRSRQQSQLVTAPRDGYIQQLVANQGGEYVKEGDPLFVLVPHMKQQAVQIWVDGNDAPLIEDGRHVRLQFEGWPAVQFSGWPSVAVGTFGGRVALVDPTDDGNGRFRVLIVPDENDQPWPEHPYLRQGVRANGWILLDRVSLGYEVWRRINGFPPALQSREKAGKTSKPALPK